MSAPNPLPETPGPPSGRQSRPSPGRGSGPPPGPGRGGQPEASAPAPSGGPRPRPAFDDHARVTALLERAAADFMEGPGNRSVLDGERLFADPFFGFAAGDDPVWEELLEHFGPAFWTPAEAFRRGRAHAASAAAGASPGAAPEASPPASAEASPEASPDPSPEELSVVVFVCPQTRETMADHGRAVGFPSKRWVVRYFHHQRVIGGLKERLAEELRAGGFEAWVPDHLPGFGETPHERLQIVSPWSHRHAGYAAGLGTFGLCDGLITRAGKAHRMGSLVVRARCEPTPRSYSGPYDWCLFHRDGRCAKCADRCPAGAITRDGHDKLRCRSFLEDVTAVRVPELWPELAGTYGCGLCQSAVPCDVRRPGRRDPA